MQKRTKSDQMQILSLSSRLSSANNTEGHDVVAMKKALESLGDYEAPDYGITSFPDTALFEGMKRFQKRNGLKVDGIANPGGETEEKLNRLLRTNNPPTFQQSSRNAAEGNTAKALPLSPTTALLKIPKTALSMTNPARPTGNPARQPAQTAGAAEPAPRRNRLHTPHRRTMSRNPNPDLPPTPPAM